MPGPRSVNDYYYVLSDFLVHGVVTFLQANTSVAQAWPDGSSVQDKLLKFNSSPAR